MNEQTRKASQFLTDLDIESYSKKEDLVDLMYLMEPGKPGAIVPEASRSTIFRVITLKMS